MIFTWDQVARIREGKLKAGLVPLTYPVGRRRAGRLVRRPSDAEPVVRVLRREIRVFDGDGNQVGKKIEPVMDGGVPVVVTITACERVRVFDLTVSQARELGFRTPDDAKSAWRARHPRSDFAYLVRFELGDRRDRPLFLTSTRSMKWDELGHGGTGDYTFSPARASDDAEAVPPEVVDSLSRTSRQRDVRRRADAERGRRDLSLSERVAALEAVGAPWTETIRQELRIIEQRAERAERRLAREEGEV